MKQKTKQESWIMTTFHFASSCKVKITLSVIFELCSVIGGLIPYIAVYELIIKFVDGTPTMEDLATCFLWYGLGYVIKIIAHAIATTFSHYSAYTILEQIRKALSEKLMKAPLGTVLDYSGGQLKSLLVDRVETIELPLAHMIPEGISNFMLPILVFGYLLIMNWQMALASLINVVLAVIIYAVMMRTYSQKYDEFMKASNEVNNVIVEYVEGIEVIKAFGRSGSSYEKYANQVSSFKDYTLDWFQSTWKLMNLGGAILPSTLLGTLPVGLILYFNGTLSIAQLVICFILSMGIVGPLTAFTVFVNELKAIEYSIRDVKVILDLPELEDAKEEVELQEYSVELQNVSFAYDKDKTNTVLQHVDLTLPQNSYTALVGPSGSGKSTIARLIARYWDVDNGTISIGGVNIKDIPLSQLSQYVSFVTQDNFLFHSSLKENIRLANPNASDEEVYRAARLAQCDGFINKLEHGYDTSAGEAGKKLSGGEKQRIAIARAILKDSPIIILDEATTFTDPENEVELQKSIMELTKDKTLLVIAHRLSTIKNADNIVVLNDGAIVEQGTHQQLLDNCPLYNRMWYSHIGAKKWAMNTNEEVA